MKKLVFLALLLLPAFAFSQKTTLPDYEDIPLDNAEDYKAADSIAHIAANYILSKPFKATSSNRQASLKFMMKWMDGTPDYTFTIDQVALKISKGNNDMLGIYLAAMVKYCLEHPKSAKNTKKVRLNAVKMVIDYCQNTDNNMEMTKELKKYAAADAKGKLEETLDKVK